MLLPINNPVISTILCSITEITNGIFLCSRLNIDTTYICIIITAVNAFGGISTLMQTAGITRQNNINIKSYLYGKIILTIVSIVNAMIILLH
jgi:DNA-binding phage protein